MSGDAPATFIPSGTSDPDELFDEFSRWAESRGLTFYPAQEEALIELVSGANVILSTPTGSGKSLVAAGATSFALGRGQRTFYTAPIKALVSEKFFDLCAQFGADSVGMMTGDATVNAGAPIICATAEVLANLALRTGADADVGLIVMDEFHYYGDTERGWAWQVPIVELPRAQFLLMSATLGDVTFFADDLRRRTGRETASITGTQRPVPLDYSYVLTSVHDTIERLIEADRAPVYVVHFTQASAVERAQALLSANICSREQRDAIAVAIGDFRFTSGFGNTLSKLVRAGIGVHHAGMLPRYRRLVERLAQQGLLKVVAGTDTLGVGINVPIRTVLLTGLTKYDGVKTRHLQAREFHQIVGRAGRAGYDTRGFVVAQAPEHDVENARATAKAGDDPKKLKKIQRKKAPEGFVSWGEPTFERLIAAPPEPLRSHFKVTTSMVIDVIARPANCFTSMRHLLEDNHEPRERQRKHILRAIEIYRGLRTAGLVESMEPDASGKAVRLTTDLPANFALSNPLSSFAIAAMEILDTEDPGYAFDALSVIESTIEDPRPILRAQRSAARDVAIAEMKSDGIEYDERMELLEEITWPMPLFDLLEGSFDIYRRGHPWVSGTPPSPKSIVREMVEQAMGFNDFVARYKLARSEGVVLRYLTDVYRSARHGLPTAQHTPELDDLIEWLGDLVRRVDSSLIDEWEQLTHPDDDGAPTDARPPTTGPNLRACRVQIRNHMFALISAISRRDWPTLYRTHPDVAWSEELAEYFDEYGELDAGPQARSPQLFALDESDETWRVRQTFDDPQGDRGWSLTAQVEIATDPDVDEADRIRMTDMEIHPG
ncbi:DEAD/DEAH box helicase [Williamsia maris]|uniref:Helicase conserved C-terminal domain-containing protein n=1 Tax=Williamsia maris TaxID=72806 RepID=A0ABT1HKK3_9NOCA|nr:DEAD/DEAH box helicase [Williamsia maris]MCP2178468.1 Helicase conserved C-terminal domain-containing protein [Williamsia maris]